MSRIEKFIDKIVNLMFKQLNREEKNEELLIDEKQEEVIFEDFKTLEIGDVITAKRYSSIKEMKKYPPGHQTGPFIITKVEGNNISAFKGTSNTKIINDTNACDHITYILDILEKETVFNIKEEITITPFMYGKKVGRLTKDEMDYLKTKLKKVNDKKFEIGSIIKYNGLYYIITDIDINNINAIELIKDKNKNSIRINATQYSITDSEIKIPITSKIQHIDIIQKEKIKVIQERLNDIKEQNIEKAERGCLIEQSGKLYYVYGIESDKLNCFRINHVTNSNNIVIINGSAYNALFDSTVDIKISSIYKVALKASEKEMQDIKNIKKDYSKNKVREKKKKNTNPYTINKNIKPRCVVEDATTYDRTKYIVLKRVNDTIYIISLEDVLNNKMNRVICENVRDFDLTYTLDKLKFLDICNKINKIDEKAVDQSFLSKLKK